MRIASTVHTDSLIGVLRVLQRACQIVDGQVIVLHDSRPTLRGVPRAVRHRCRVFDGACVVRTTEVALGWQDDDCMKGST